MTIPDQTGKVFVITGANAGIGRVTALELARANAHVIMACRSEERARPEVDVIRKETRNEAVEFVPLDLADFESVRACAALLNARAHNIDGLINNGGLLGRRGLTQSGFEIHFGVNHMGHFLLTTQLLDKIERTAGARIVNVASRAHQRAHGLDWESVRKHTQTYSGFPEYSVSKLANVLFSAELARRTSARVYALHPGVVASNIWNRAWWPFRNLIKLFMISNEDGAKTQLYCATSPDVADETGCYYDKCQPKTPSTLGRDAALARELWARSEDWVK